MVNRGLIGENMTREELKKHCLKQIEICEMWAKHRGEEPHGKVYEEHKLILELLEQEPKTGHWISEIIQFRCSECGYVVNPWNNTSYCPNCWTRMEE